MGREGGRTGNCKIRGQGCDKTRVTCGCNYSSRDLNPKPGSGSGGKCTGAGHALRRAIIAQRALGVSEQSRKLRLPQFFLFLNFLGSPQDLLDWRRRVDIWRRPELETGDVGAIGFVKEKRKTALSTACNRICCFTARRWTSSLRFGAHPPPPPLT